MWSQELPEGVQPQGLLWNQHVNNILPSPAPQTSRFSSPALRWSVSHPSLSWHAGQMCITVISQWNTGVRTLEACGGEFWGLSDVKHHIILSDIPQSNSSLFIITIYSVLELKAKIKQISVHRTFTSFNKNIHLHRPLRSRNSLWKQKRLVF